jgi:S1-C subfamily serine protease
MTKEEREKRAQLMRMAIPAAVCLVAVVVVVLGTRAWQPALAQGQSQAMDLRGQWLGMRLASTDSQTATSLGVPPELKGVVVADVQADSRATAAGLMSADVLARIDGSPLTSLMDMYTLSTRIDVTRPLQVDFLRAGRPMTVIVPPAPAPPMTAVAPPATTPCANCTTTL